MKINLMTTLIILLFSSVIGITFNFFSSNGIPLLRQIQTVEFAEELIIIDVDEEMNQNELTGAASPEILPTEERVDVKPVEEVKADETSTKEDISSEKKDNEIKNLPPPFSEPKAVTLEQAKTLYNQKTTFIDARDRGEYLIGHIKDAVNIPYYGFEEFEYQLDFIPLNKPIVIYCSGTDCDLSVMLGNKLFKLGYSYIYIFFGGWNNWVENNLPVNGGIDG
jgi:rhodanese-related sulfurtransferase